MKSPDRFRDEALTRALDDAIARPTEARGTLYDRVRRASGLPGPRLNTGLVRAFAGEVGRRGEAADPLVAAMLAFHENLAPYGHVDEVFPILAVAALGARAACDEKTRRATLEALEEASCDRRSRVRDEVARALATIGEQVGPPFADVLNRWIADDQTYLAHAAVTALGEEALLTAFDATTLGSLLDAAYQRLGREHRAGRRHDAFRKLQRAMAVVPPVVVARHPVLAAVLEKNAAHEDEDVRRAVEGIVETIRRGRAGDRAQAIADAVAAARKPSRDPRWDRLPGKRGRGH